MILPSREGDTQPTLDIVVFLLGGLFVILGLNALFSTPRRVDRPADEGPPAASPRTRRIAGVFWLVWGTGFIAAALFHVVP